MKENQPRNSLFQDTRLQQDYNSGGIRLQAKLTPLDARNKPFERLLDEVLAHVVDLDVRQLPRVDALQDMDRVLVAGAEDVHDVLREQHGALAVHELLVLEARLDLVVHLGRRRREDVEAEVDRGLQLVLRDLAADVAVALNHCGAERAVSASWYESVWEGKGTTYEV